jgi:uncharacterized membrane protein YczE
VHGVSQVIARPGLADLRSRGPRLLVGLTLGALGIAMQVRSSLGADPWTVFHEGVADHSPLTIGQATVVVGLAMFALWFPLRMRPGVGTPINVLGVGFATDGFLALLPETHAWAARAAYLGGGVVIMSVGIGLYLSAHLGTGPRDGVMVALAARGISLRAARTIIEIVVLVAGWALGGTVGVGTALFAISVGPIGQATLRRVDLPVPLAAARVSTAPDPDVAAA